MSSETRTAGLSAYIDCSDMRLGDRMACAWLAQHRRLRTGERFGVIDDFRKIPEPFAMDLYFPQTFTSLRQQDIQINGLPKWDQGNLWLTATNAFAAEPVNGFFEHIPADVLEKANALKRQRSIHGRKTVLMHVLNDAPYNRSRNWHPNDTRRLIAGIQNQKLHLILLNPTKGHFLGDYPKMLAEMLAADLFIGGDTGPSHLWSLLCPDKPQLAIYPSMRAIQRTFTNLQNELGYSEPWNSTPKKRDIRIVEMTCSRRWVMENGWPGFHRVGRFDVDSVLQIISSM